MYRRQLRACPRCRAAMGIRVLDLEEKGRVEVDLCEGCVGAFFDFSDGTPSRLARALGGWPPVSPEVLSDSSEASDCAACGAGMSQHPQLDGVWRCRRCAGVFADSVGLDQLSRVALPRRAKDAYTTLDDWLDQLHAWLFPRDLP